jgi:hypothetical protein
MPDVTAVVLASKVDCLSKRIGAPLCRGHRVTQRGDSNYPTASGDDRPICRLSSARMKKERLVSWRKRGRFAGKAADRVTFAWGARVPFGSKHHSQRNPPIPLSACLGDLPGKRCLQKVDKVAF